MACVERDAAVHGRDETRTAKIDTGRQLFLVLVDVAACTEAFSADLDEAKDLLSAVLLATAGTTRWMGG